VGGGGGGWAEVAAVAEVVEVAVVEVAEAVVGNTTILTARRRSQYYRTCRTSERQGSLWRVNTSY
jgi:hypothetical protein